MARAKLSPHSDHQPGLSIWGPEADWPLRPRSRDRREMRARHDRILCCRSRPATPARTARTARSSAIHRAVSSRARCRAVLAADALGKAMAEVEIASCLPFEPRSLPYFGRRRNLTQRPAFRTSPSASPIHCADRHFLSTDVRELRCTGTRSPRRVPLIARHSAPTPYRALVEALPCRRAQDRSPALRIARSFDFLRRSTDQHREAMPNFLGADGARPRASAIASRVDPDIAKGYCCDRLGASRIRFLDARSARNGASSIIS